MPRATLIGLLLALLATDVLAAGPPAQTGFTFQGRIRQNDLLVNETCDLKARLYDAESGGNQIGPELTFDDLDAIPVDKGLFSVLLDFGSVFDGNALWLEFEIASPSGSAFVAVSPRQPIDPAPYSVHALNGTVWGSAGNNIYYETGNVGINNPSPAAPLHVGTSTSGSQRISFISNLPDGVYGLGIYNPVAPFSNVSTAIYYDGSYVSGSVALGGLELGVFYPRMVVQDDYLSIGTSNGSTFTPQLDVDENGAVILQGIVNFRDTVDTEPVTWMSAPDATWPPLNDDGVRVAYHGAFLDGVNANDYMVFEKSDTSPTVDGGFAFVLTGEGQPTFDALIIRQEGVGIGTKDVTDTLTVAGSGRFTSSVQIDGDLTAMNCFCASDARFKTSINAIDNPIDRLSQLNGVHYDWRTDEFPDRNFTNERQVGVLAQEVMAVLPAAVSVQDDGYYSVAYDRLVPLLIEGVKEQQQTIETQQQQLETQQRQIESHRREFGDLAARLEALEQLLAERN